jgi:hypothetical protein
VGLLRAPSWEWRVGSERPRLLGSAGSCGRSSTARAPAFQAGGAGSIPVARSSVPTKRVVLNTIQKLILGAAAALFATSTVLAVAQPGGLGDDDGDDSAAPAAETTTTTISHDATTSTTVGSVTTTTAGGTTSTTIATSVPETTSTTQLGATPTTRPSSGIGASGAGNVGDDIANTGHESMAAAGLALLGLGLSLRRAARVELG